MAERTANTSALSPLLRPFNSALLALLLLALLVRAPGLGRPLLGNFATKNVVYATIARNWCEGNAPWWQPTLDCLRGGERSLHLLEVPVSAYVAGTLWSLFGGSLDVWGRLTSIAFSVAATGVLWSLVRRWHGNDAALGAALVFALSPVGILYGQSFMLEASVAFFAVATMAALQRWLDVGRTEWLLAAAVCLALLLLSKIYTLVLLMPLTAMTWAARRGETSDSQQPRWGAAVALALMAMLPAGVWIGWVWEASAPTAAEFHRIFYSLRDSGQAHRPPHPLLFSLGFYRHLAQDLATVVLTPVGVTLLVAGFCHRARRQHVAWLASTVLLIVALPAKFFAMNYYWVVLLPPLAVYCGLGCDWIAKRLRPSKRVALALVMLGFVCSLRYAVKPAFLTPREDHAVLAAAAAVRQRSDGDEPIVTMHGSTLDLLYYTRRVGWALSPDTEELDAALAECHEQGARLLVVADLAGLARHRESQALLDSLPVLVEGDDYRVYRLTADLARRRHSALRR